MKTIDFNLNYNFLVKFTDLGYDKLVKDHNKAIINFASMEKVDINYFKNKADKNGYTKIQAHEFIDKFGKLGFDLTNYLDINIKIEIKL